MGGGRKPGWACNGWRASPEEEGDMDEAAARVASFGETLFGGRSTGEGRLGRFISGLIIMVFLVVLFDPIGRSGLLAT
jgi:hypothetical protein